MAPPSSRSERQLRLRAAQIAYLDDVVGQTGRKLSRIAVDAGMNATTLTRFRNDTERGGTLALPTLMQVAAHTRVPLPPELMGDDGEQPLQLREPEAVPYKAQTGDTLAELVSAYLRDRNNLYAVMVKARSLVSRGIRPGDVLIMDINGRPQPGDVVIAQLYDWQMPDKTETVLRLYMPPVLFAGGEDYEVPRLIDDRSVGIKGVMLAKLGGRLGQEAA